MIKKLPIAFIMIFASSTGLTSKVSAYEVGDQIEPFSLKRWEMDVEYNLSEQPEGIVILDFFAYWCIPCLKTSTEIEQIVLEHYRSQGRNPAGLPVQVVSTGEVLDNGVGSFWQDFFPDTLVFK
jgi:thiol-disulfide isomerase/thioredoxin